MIYTKDIDAGIYGAAGVYTEGGFNPYGTAYFAGSAESMLATGGGKAGYLDSVATFPNLSTASYKGSDATQGTGTLQGKALPLIDGKGYLHLSGVTGNYASIPTYSAVEALSDVEIIININSGQTVGGTWFYLVSKDSEWYFAARENDYVFQFPNGHAVSVNETPLSKPWIKFTYNHSTSTGTVFHSLNGVDWTQVGSRVNVATYNPSASSGDIEICKNGIGAVRRVIIKNGIGGTVVTDIDFTATNVRHGDTKFKCATGQVVTINQAGNDPATIIRKPVLRLDGVNDSYSALFASPIAGVRMFFTCTVLGNGGETGGRMLGMSKFGSADIATTGSVVLYNSAGNTASYFEGAVRLTRSGGFSGTHIHEVLLSGSAQKYLLDGGSELTNATSLTIEPDRFFIAATEVNSQNASLDIYEIILTAPDITEDAATAIRNFINNRNNVFDLKDGFGYYFYNPQDLSSGAVASWNGRIVGSENGDTDKFATQGTANDQPVGDGYVVTFADNTDHLDIPSTTQVGWQVVGTSLGTFAYRVNNTAVTELNLLGNLGSATYRKAGDLYGAILLPESATGADIQKARKLLIDRGAADGVTGSSLSSFWHQRGDIVEFRSVDTASVTSFFSTWQSCSSLTSFPLIDTSSGISFTYAWINCTSLTSFPLIDTSSGTSFSSAWQSCSSLTSFPLIDTSSGMNFAYAWFGCRSLTSFPLIDTSSGTNFGAAWYNCASLTSFPLIDTSSGTNFTQAWQNCNSLTSFPLIDTSSGTYFAYAWYNCNSLTSFPAGFFDSWNPSSISSGVFNAAWYNCTPLTAQSVENILTSIDASGHFATTNKLAGGTPLGDAGIDIDYNGDPLTAATTSAITSLKSKGWVIFINYVAQ